MILRATPARSHQTLPSGQVVIATTNCLRCPPLPFPRPARTPSQDVVIGAGCHDNSHLPAVAISSLGAPCARIHPRNHCRWGCDDSLLPVLAASAPCTPHRHALTGRCQGGRLSQQHPFARGDRLCPLRASHRYAPTGRSDGAGLHALACIASNMNVVQHSPATALGQIAELLSAKLGTPTPPRDMAMGPDCRAGQRAQMKVPHTSPMFCGFAIANPSSIGSKSQCNGFTTVPCFQPPLHYQGAIPVVPGVRVCDREPALQWV